ncbi:LPS export ABC transporter periplasmic protein LptC [Winogradskyella sp. J14-2]|uniref:LPS export ABC transporter periplasmic protein LptC n=1 Tax=Winogradskyella sp. J14-2 TaxID=1936080 RepID=UPI000972C7B1|nr:LPS export ABC transporter periplasmic protein LptC [Winogradskyella sp. J14-2]APY07989.1 LPS export ABC transporter periplasmic protein LptC [Winogradskyella sp. J14-2]
MKLRFLHITTNLVTVLTVTLFFSCENDFDEVQKVGVLQNQPIGEAENIDLKYTEFIEDSVRLKANLLSPKMLDYSNRDFAFSEFPDGIVLKVYDTEGKITTITSRYAIFFKDTDIIDLRGNVTITTHQNEKLVTDQLFYNEKLEWVFTNEPWVFTKIDGPKHGIGFDSDKDFKKFQMLEMGGDFEFDN